MKTIRWILTAHLLLLMSCWSLVIYAAEATLKVTSISQVELAVVRNGLKQILRISPDKAVPGTEVIFTNTVENVGQSPASDIVVKNHIPSDTEYLADSAFGNDCAILYSADGGKTFATAENLRIRGADGQQYLAQPRQYTDIRWNMKGQLAGGTSSEVGFRAAIR